MQCAIIHKNHARDNHSHSQFKEVSRDMKKGVVNTVDECPSSDDDTGVCVVEWIDILGNRPMACPFLKPGAGKRMK
jgi:hypothetical protein